MCVCSLSHTETCSHNHHSRKKKTVTYSERVFVALVTLKRVRITIIPVDNPVTYSECVSVALVKPHARRIRRIILSSVVSVCPYCIFPQYLTNGTIFGERLLNIKCVFWFSLQLPSEICFIPRRIQPDMIINVYRCSCKVPIDFITLQWNLNFLNWLLKNPQT